MSRFLIPLAALLLVFSGCTSPVTPPNSAPVSRATLTTTTGDGTVLDLWQWSFASIQNVLPQVAAAGYSAIQVSPVQGTKSNTSLANGFAWYLFYQPTNLKVGNAQLGSEQDFKNLCAAAQTYGIKIIVDAVLNHVADNGSSGTFDPAVDSSIANYSYFHNKGTVVDWANRYDMTQENLGNGPDWNTQNSYVQSLHLAFLNQAIADGAGGFRFDAAKSIETTVGSDAGQSWAGTWWNTMLAGMTGASNLFLYGEVLSGTNDNDDGYQTFMRTTAVDYISAVSSAVDGTNLASGNLLNITHTGGYTATENPAKVVLYIENWDNYMGAVGIYTANFSYTKRLLANAIMSSRASAVNIVFARPNENLWSDPVMSAVNNFKNAAVGKSEYLRNPNGNNAVLIVERGTLGATIINAGGSSAITSATNLPSGSYTAVPSGNVFTVANGTLTGTVPGTTAVVIQASGTPTAATPTFSPAAGAVTSGTVITISSSTSGSTVYYTTDGSTPTTASAHGTAGAASATVTVTAAQTIKALAAASGYSNSAVGSAAYTIASGYTANNTAMALRGTMNSWGTTAMTLVANYTWQVQVTLAASTAYQYKYDASGAWTTGKNWGVGGVNGSNISFTSTTAGTYTFQFNDSTLAYSVTGGTAPTAATPTFNPAAGAVASGTVVMVSSATSGSTVYYTTDGSTPTTSSSHGTAGAASAAVTVSTAQTIKALAVATGYTNSAVASAAYTIATTTGTLTVIFINNGTAQSVTFPGDANNWSLTANTLSAAASSTSTVTVANAVTSTNLARGNNTAALELQVCNTASGWSGAWAFGSWTKTSNITFSNAGNSQISIACNAGQNVTLTINVGSSSLSAVVQ